MKTKTKKKAIKVLSPSLEKSYKRRKRISSDTGKMERKIKILKEERDKIDEMLAPAFEEYGNKRKLSDGTIVVRKIIEIDPRLVTPEMSVGDIITSGYEWPKYSELQGD